MPLTWSRTLIAGEAKPYDFTASDCEVKVGRIYRHDTGGIKSGGWFWAMNAIGAGVDRTRAQCSGIAETKEEAVAAVDRAWEACRG